MLAPLIVLQAVMGYVFYDRHVEDTLISSANRMASEIGYIRRIFLKNNHSPDLELLNDFKVSFSKNYYITNQPFDYQETCTTDSYIIRQFTEFLRRHEPSILVCEYQPDDMYQIVIPFPNQYWLILKAHRKQFLSGKWHFLPVWSIGSAFVLALIAALFLRNQVRPIIRLSKALEDLGRGDNQSSYHPSGAIEIRTAGIEFLKMRQRLIEHINSRTMLLAGVSHDLRTILTRLKLEISLLTGSSEEVNNMKSDVKQMQAILDSYFSFISDAASEEPEIVDVTAEVKALTERYKTTNHTILVQSVLKQPIAIQKNSFIRCIMNLLSNAQRYGTVIHISLSLHDNRKGKFVKLIIEDNGPGVPEKDYKNIFEPFFSDNISRTLSNSHGEQLGLGLSIVRNIITTKGGIVTAAHSKRLGGLQITLLYAI